MTLVRKNGIWICQRDDGSVRRCIHLTDTVDLIRKLGWWR